MATEELVKKNNGVMTASERASACRQVTLDWLNVYAQIYRETLTEELILAYQVALEDLNAELLHKAFRRAMKLSTFRPTPAEVLNAYQVEIERAPKPKQLDAPPMSEGERADIQAAFDNLREKLSLPRSTPIKDRMEQLDKQKAEIMKKYPAKAKAKSA